MKTLPDLFRRMMETFHQEQWKRVLLSYALQPRQERNARLRTVMALSVELDRIRQQSTFATGLAEAALEDIIEGDWESAGHFVEWFTFKDEAPDTQARYGPLWERFRDILQAAVIEAQARSKGAAGGN